MFKKVIVFVVAMALIVQGHTVFATESRKKVGEISVTNYWAERFPSFKEKIENKAIGKLVQSDEIYVKYTPKDVHTLEALDAGIATEDDFIFEVFTKEEYQQEVARQEIASNIGTFSIIGGFEPNGTCSWLRLDLQVYETGVTGKYEAYSFWEWKTIPQFRLRDVNGIHVSSEMLIGRNFKDSIFVYREKNSDSMYYKFPTVEISQYGNGIAAAFALPGDSEIFQYDSFMGMIATDIEFANSSSLSGRVYTTYGHSYITIGGISFDSKGLPSIGLINPKAEFSGSVYIKK